MRETSIETRLINRVENLGGMCKKWVSPGWNGAPDRICFFPHGIVYYIELKRPGKDLRKKQAYRRDQLQALGHKVKMINTYEGIEEFIEEVTNEMERSKKKER